MWFTTDIKHVDFPDAVEKFTRTPHCSVKTTGKSFKLTHAGRLKQCRHQLSYHQNHDPYPAQKWILLYSHRVILMPTSVAMMKKLTRPLNSVLAKQLNPSVPFFLTCIDLCHELNTVHVKPPETDFFNLSALIGRI